MMGINKIMYEFRPVRSIATIVPFIRHRQQELITTRLLIIAVIVFSNIQISYAYITDPLAKQLDDFMKKPITNDSQKVKSITEQEYNDKTSQLNKVLAENGYNFSITIPYKESCYYHEDDKYLYETYQCIE